MNRPILVLICLALITFVVLGEALATTYRLQDIRSFTSGSSYASGINDYGSVVGEFNSSGATNAFIWENSTGRNLGNLGGNSSAWSINNQGKVAGYSHTKTTSSERAFIWDNVNGMLDLGTLGGERSIATDINDSTHVVGQAQTSSSDWHAFLWKDGFMRDIGTLGGSWSEANDINHLGQIAGRSSTSGLSLQRAFFWDSATGMRDIGTLGGVDSYAYGLNDYGYVVGGSITSNRESHAFLWDGCSMIDLGTLTLGYRSSLANDINNRGQVVGWSYGPEDNPTPRAFIWESGTGMIDLNTLIEEPGWVLNEAKAINGLGQIVGWGTYNAQPQAFLLTPVPEPSSLVVMLGGFGTLAGMIRRRS